ncbi:hypothetical protein [Mucilaginibacter gynuensis]
MKIKNSGASVTIAPLFAYTAQALGSGPVSLLSGLSGEKAVLI